MIYNNNQNTPFSIYITNLEKYNEGFLIGECFIVGSKQPIEEKNR